ncbi:MAG TPA: hypothetical protein DIW62_02305 [Raoultella sp.]|nr:hypothetical protein [Raoultella sp.]
MKYIKMTSFIIFIGTLYILYAFYLREGYIKEIYQHSERSEIWGVDCKSTVVLVDNAPLSHDAQTKFWEKNSTEIMKKWTPLTDRCDEILFVNNRIGRIKRSGDMNHWIADDAICLNGILGGCISWSERLFYVQIDAPKWKDEVGTDNSDTHVHLSFID